MKTNRKGKVVLQGRDYRVGNFVFHEENYHVKVMTISSIVSWRIGNDTAIGQIVRIAIREHHDNWLKTYAAMNFSQLMVVPTGDFFEKHAKLLNDQTTSHPEFYGKPKMDLSKEEDDKIIEEEREFQEEIEKVAK